MPKFTNSFILALLALIGEGLLAWHGKPTGGLATIAGLYIGSRAGLKGTGMIAASRDSQADTQKAIETLKD
jgi:hypothetical protein